MSYEFSCKRHVYFSISPSLISSNTNIRVYKRVNKHIHEDREIHAPEKSIVHLQRTAISTRAKNQPNSRTANVSPVSLRQQISLCSCRMFEELRMNERDRNAHKGREKRKRKKGRKKERNKKVKAREKKRKKEKKSTTTINPSERRYEKHGSLMRRVEEKVGWIDRWIDE